MKNFKIFIILTVTFLLMSVAYAGDDNSQDDVKVIEKTDNNDISSSAITDTTADKEDNNNQYMDVKTDNGIEKSTDTSTTPKQASTAESLDDFEYTGDCCTTIMQVSENESAISFRRDSTGSTSSIYVVNNSTHIKQYKTVNGYFFHVLISKDGWLFGNGGGDNVNVNRLIEIRANTMIANNRITRDDLYYIGSLHRQLGIGHFIIKAPDGRYGMEIYRDGSMINMGTLQNGQYIVCPNSKKYYHSGNYVDYTKTSDVVNASRLLALKDPYGLNRRNIMTYHYKRNMTTATIDFYAGNDDGSYVGVRTAYLRDNIVTPTKTVTASQLPTTLRGMYIDTYTYVLNDTPVPKVDFVITTSQNTTKMGNNITFTAKLNIYSNPVDTGFVIFKINGITIRNSQNQTVRAYLNDGLASYTYTIPDGWSAKSVKLTAVYSKDDYGRIENKTYFALTRPDIHMQLDNVTSNTRTIHITGKLLDEHDHKVLGENIFSVKVSGLTIKNGDEVALFKVVDGVIDIQITLPDYYKSGNHTIVLATGTRGAYNSGRASCNLNLSLDETKT